MKTIVSAIAAFTLFTTAAFAATPAALPDAQVKERIAYIQGALDAAQPSAQAWWYTWIALYSTGAVVQGTLAGVTWKGDKFERDRHYLYARKVWSKTMSHDMLVGGLTCAVGLGGKLIFAFEPAYLPNRLRRMPDSTPAERLAKLTAAEDYLNRCAVQEIDGWGWRTHLLNLGVNLGAGLSICLTRVYCLNKSWKRGAWDGFLMFVQGEAVSIIDIYSQPRHAIRDRDAYEARYKKGKLVTSNLYGPDPLPEIFVGLCPGGSYGMTVGMRF